MQKEVQVKEKVEEREDEFMRMGEKQEAKGGKEIGTEEGEDTSRI